MGKTFQIGDIVKLKAGPDTRPAMVVNGIYNNENLQCVWYNTNAQDYKFYEFNPEALEKVEETPSDVHDRLGTVK